MNQITKITLAWELFGQDIPRTRIAQRLEVNRETIGIWIKSIQGHSFGLRGFIDDYLKAKKGERTKGS
ncbi:hypothetical protein FJZ40_01865 [Candidatus Shapirobacteria bacterium]|nr:hypothetical protein [Candidatus Shapirobacteria bacterium]